MPRKSLTTSKKLFHPQRLRSRFDTVLDRAVRVQHTRAGAYRHNSLSSTIEKPDCVPLLLLGDIITAPVAGVRSKGHLVDRRSRPPCRECQIPPKVSLGSNWGQTTAPRDTINRSIAACRFPLGRCNLPASYKKDCRPAYTNTLISRGWPKLVVG